MTQVAQINDLLRSHMNPPSGMVFHDSINSALDDLSLLGYWSAISRAWKELELCGVLCMDRRPVLYLRKQDRPYEDRQRRRLHKLFWNQGIANVLVLIDPNTVYIYSGLAKPVAEGTVSESEEEALVKTYGIVEYIQQVFSFQHSLATGRFYEQERNKFNPEDAVDSYLLSNLGALRNQLVQGKQALEIKDAHALIGRLLFVCYILDREIYSIGDIINGQTGTTLLADKINSFNREPQKGIDFLYDLFLALKGHFNGNMFDQDLEAEKSLITSSHLKDIASFLNADDLETKQATLGFWAYDFKMIPVETISAIYQEFLAKEDKEGQRKLGAVYTPRFLAEMVVDTAMADNQEALNWSYLDPSCGSGIFLVILFNRLAIHWINSQEEPPGYQKKAEALQKILRTQIRGIDCEETACRIACFSLYLAYLDYFEPSDIDEYIKRTKKPLPKLLDYGPNEENPKPDIPVISVGDFLQDEIINEEVDSIIGNPPWALRGKFQTAQRFVEKIPEFLKDGGVSCLLVPIKLFTNETDKFQVEWLTQITLQLVIQLADYRRQLFNDAKTPAMIMKFIKTQPELRNHLIEYNAPKFDRAGLRKGVIYVSPSARSWLPLSKIVSEAKKENAPVTWKRKAWGTYRDQKFLDLLQMMPSLSDIAGEPNEGKRWIKGQGFKPDKKGNKMPTWSQSDLYIDARDYKAPCWKSKCIVLEQDDCEQVGDKFTVLSHRPDERHYKSPMVIFSQGFTKIAYCDFNVLFRHALQSISGPKKDSDLLKFLAVYLRSDLVKYFLFHTAVDLASERDRVRLKEVLRIPFPLPGSELIAPEAEEIVAIVASRLGEFRETLKSTQMEFQIGDGNKSLFEFPGNRIVNNSIEWLDVRKRMTIEFQSKMERYINKYFQLTEQETKLISDTVDIFFPSATPTSRNSSKIKTLDPVNRAKVEPYTTKGLSAYADTLTSTLNSWAESEKSEYRVRAEGWQDEYTGLAMVSLIMDHSIGNYQEVIPPNGITGILVEFYKHSQTRIGLMVYQRDIIWFQGDRIRIIRPNILLNWTQTAALNDAAKIYGDIALNNKE